jgi:hypothetical protein
VITIDQIAKRTIHPSEVKPDGPLTSPRSWGGYELPEGVGATRRFRFGNHPVRMHELEREFDGCVLVYLFRSRSDARDAAALMCSGSV